MYFNILLKKKQVFQMNFNINKNFIKQKGRGALE